MSNSYHHPIGATACAAQGHLHRRNNVQVKLGMYNTGKALVEEWQLWRRTKLAPRNNVLGNLCVKM
eukprot:3427757-Prorocentrum_lima.AAC.1